MSGRQPDSGFVAWGGEEYERGLAVEEREQIAELQLRRMEAKGEERLRLLAEEAEIHLRFAEKRRHIPYCLF